MVKRKGQDFSDDEEETEFSPSDSKSKHPVKQAKATKSQQSKQPKKKENFVPVDGEEGSLPQPKKRRTSISKARDPPQAKETLAESEEEADGITLNVKNNDEGDKYLDLGKKRRATVRSVFLDIREYYGPEGDEKPGKKGVTLSQEQWNKLKQSSEVIDILFKKAKK
ncbi:uncharacterized protein FIBRA_03205 [Fibroporia radiculosa]|uniref:Transcriptional coactivator p15 (PC4) C-terminal domain-containing protein n=1 Tax=Fibroporia radiculosa TaxID=599839 RepID=J4HVV2_9APHY|nr:uncharacterized protein FIBRA_03205 [Fibroporia radiculosa]CCM01157.1 predicted protein [Fibroporia radiculosa]